MRKYIIIDSIGGRHATIKANSQVEAVSKYTGAVEPGRVWASCFAIGEPRNF